MPKNECNFAYICATHIHQIDVIFSPIGIQRLYNDLKLDQHSQKLVSHISGRIYICLIISQMPSEVF